MANRIKEYLTDPFLAQMYGAIRTAGPLRAILLDITHVCNLRCEGCYFFAEDMDRFPAPVDESVFDQFIADEKARGTNYVSVVGGEPTLILDRVKKIYDHFRMIVVTNGLRRIPYEGFENMPIAISVCGDHSTDMRLRGKNKLDIFANFYGDINHLGGNLDHREGFARVRDQIERAIERFPDRVLLSSYVSNVVSTGKLHDQRWGYDVCCSLTFDHPKNQDRLKNGNMYNPHFRAYYPDLKTTRRCCIGEARDCSNCFDVWAHVSWIMLHLEDHLSSKEEFTNWLTTTYLFYLANRIVDFEAGIKLLPEVHRRTKELRASARSTETTLP